MAVSREGTGMDVTSFHPGYEVHASIELYYRLHQCRQSASSSQAQDRLAKLATFFSKEYPPFRELFKTPGYEGTLLSQDNPRRFDFPKEGLEQGRN